MRLEAVARDCAAAKTFTPAPTAVTVAEITSNAKAPQTVSSFAPRPNTAPAPDAARFRAAVAIKAPESTNVLTDGPI